MFVKQRDVPFLQVFMGTVRLSDGRLVVPLNRLPAGKTYFRNVGESVDHVFVKKFTTRKRGQKSSVTVVHGGVEIELSCGEKVPDPKSQGELINMLDSLPIIATVGALLSLRNDECTVLGVYPVKVIAWFLATREAFEIIGFTEGGAICFLESLKNRVNY